MVAFFASMPYILPASNEASFFDKWYGGVLVLIRQVGQSLQWSGKPKDQKTITDNTVKPWMMSNARQSVALA